MNLYLLFFGLIILCATSCLCQSSSSKTKVTSNSNKRTECPKRFKALCSHKCYMRNNKPICTCFPGYQVKSGKCVGKKERNCLEKHKKLCQQDCYMYKNKPYCDCFSGYKISKGRCVDIDECKIPKIKKSCKHGCVNTKGSYYCKKKKASTTNGTKTSKDDADYLNDEEAPSNTKSKKEEDEAETDDEYPEGDYEDQYDDEEDDYEETTNSTQETTPIPRQTSQGKSKVEGNPKKVPEHQEKEEDDDYDNVEESDLLPEKVEIRDRSNFDDLDVDPANTTNDKGTEAHDKEIKTSPRFNFDDFDQDSANTTSEKDSDAGDKEIKSSPRLNFDDFDQDSANTTSEKDIYAVDKKIKTSPRFHFDDFDQNSGNTVSEKDTDAGDKEIKTSSMINFDDFDQDSGNNISEKDTDAGDKEIKTSPRLNFDDFDQDSANTTSKKDTDADDKKIETSPRFNFDDSDQGSANTTSEKDTHKDDKEIKTSTTLNFDDSDQDSANNTSEKGTQVVDKEKVNFGDQDSVNTTTEESIEETSTKLENEDKSMVTNKTVPEEKANYDDYNDKEYDEKEDTKQKNNIKDKQENEDEESYDDYDDKEYDEDYETGEDNEVTGVDSKANNCSDGYKPDDTGACVDIDECKTDANGCSDGCVNTLGSYNCICPKGFELSPNDPYSCQDINECLTRPCSHECVNELEMTCPSLPQTDNGWYVPWGCHSGISRPGEICRLHCKPGYRMNSRYELMTCRNDLTWYPNVDLQLWKDVCIVDTPNPYIICPNAGEINFILPKGQRSTFVKIPKPITNVDWRFVTSYPSWGTRLETVLPYGRSVVEFTVKLPSSNRGYQSCKLIVNVLDKENPTMTGCPKNIERVLQPGATSTVVHWIEPVFTDNIGMSTVYRTREPGTQFGPGLHTITYVANDESGNRAFCHFTVNIKEDQAANSMSNEVNDLRRGKYHTVLICPSGVHYMSKPPDSYAVSNHITSEAGCYWRHVRRINRNRPTFYNKSYNIQPNSIHSERKLPLHVRVPHRYFNW